jgi:two-component sensor histidine kinase
MWGIISLLINFSGLIFWQYYFAKDYSGYIPIYKLNIADQLDYYMNIVFGLITITYLIIRFIKENNYATNQYIKTNFELTQTNILVSKQNDEKTVMLKEIHHRVKNNLQIITSLLRLQSRELKDIESIQHFKDATNRIIAMALIHDKMYQSDSLSKINLLNYLNKLIDDLILSYSIEIPINKTIKSDIHLISPKSLVSIALIFNELVSNSLKHAFKTTEKGTINIQVMNSKENTIITYTDNGIWLEKQKDYSFGVELIETLTEQLDGELTRDISNGTTYTFKLPNRL